jgi:cytochrome c peroxidase
MRILGAPVNVAARRRVFVLGIALAAIFLALAVPRFGNGHIVPPEKLHPAAESYRRATFVLNLNPVRWSLIWLDMAQIAGAISSADKGAAKKFKNEIAQARLIAQPKAKGGEEPDMAGARKKGRRAVFSAATRGVAGLISMHIDRAGAGKDREHVKAHLEEGRKVFQAFAESLTYLDPAAWKKMQLAWLDSFSNLGTPGILGAGARLMNIKRIRAATSVISSYMGKNFARYTAGTGQRLAARPQASPTYVKTAKIPWRLPPGSNTNKQLPRPRQLLGMAERGANEGETGLIALGDMAFDSAEIFGEPARSLNVTCNTCHNKGVTNPNFFIPGLSYRKGGMDVSNNFFVPHANNGIFGHIDIPDMRGIRFTAPYGRNGRTASLREFIRNVIVLEFNGPEPDPMLLDGMAAYINEFEFLPNPKIKPSGMLNEKNNNDSARRGEKIFHRNFPQMMGGMSCASCHIPSNHFLDRKNHNIGTAKGFAPHALDGSFDTPTLLSAKYSAPYFNDGSQPTLQAVNEWFNKRFALGLSKKELNDLTAYVEAIAGGTEAYEETIYTLDSELEEFSFFLSTYEFLKRKKKKEIIIITLKTVATELEAHKWDVQDRRHMPVLDKLESLIREAALLFEMGNVSAADGKIAAYRKLYEKNTSALK